MERVGTLINKLKDQFEQQADPEKLAQTAQLLLAELQSKRTAELVTGSVSVQMPAFVPAAKPAPKKEDLSGWLFDTPVEIPTLIHQNYSIPETPVPLNEVIGTKKTELNDHLKEERVEVAARLEETPIRDLRKAISVNDRYLFTHMLFRGDENMYERSIKTINSFSIYPEAQYWIQRELKVKLGWTENHEAVKLFDHLVKRRFS